jgi:hypothetical protein
LEWVGLNLNPHPLTAEGAAPRGGYDCALGGAPRWLGRLGVECWGKKEKCE